MVTDQTVRKILALYSMLHPEHRGSPILHNVCWRMSEANARELLKLFIPPSEPIMRVYEDLLLKGNLQCLGVPVEFVEGDEIYLSIKVA